MNAPARAANTHAIIDYFSRGFKSRQRSVGIELEHTLIREDGSPVSYSGFHGVEWILERLAETWDHEDRNDEGRLLGLSRPYATVTLEPAAQLELSAGPFESISDAAKTFFDFENELFAICNPAGIRIETRGYHPTACAETLELIPKQRYAIMNRYFKEIGPFGTDMMRGSASTQVSIDYRDETDALRKLQLAFALTPLLACITDNAPVFEGVPSPHHCMRTEIWRYCDPDRCGLIPGVFDDDFSFERYASYILDTPALIAVDAAGDQTLTHQSFSELFRERTMEEADVAQALSMFFNDARLKYYLEIRPADAMPIDYVVAYAALIKGIFYSDSSIDAVFDRLGSVDDASWHAAQDAVMTSGYDAKLYGRGAGELADALVEIALEALSADEQTFLEPLAALIRDRRCPADLVFP